MTSTTREQWLTTALDLIWHEVIEPHTLQSKPVTKVSIAPLAPKVLAQCHPKSQSDQDINEIFVNASTDDSLEILGALTHEEIHASDDCQSGHRNYFAKTARQVGLEGKLTATHAGQELTQQLQTIVDLLGPIPHAKLTTPPKQKGRNNNKIVCNACGFQANLSAKWASQIIVGFECPACRSTATNVITK